MIWRRSETSSSSEQNGKSLGRRLEGMGQLSSSELFADAKVVAVPSAVSSTDLETKPEIGSEAARLEKMVIRPSQPIDICRGPSQPKNATHFHHLQRPAQRMLQRSASEMAPAGQCPSVTNLALTSVQQKQQHQPRVIQPRWLATTGTTTTAMGAISAGGTAVYHQDTLTKSIARRYDPHNHQNMHKRSRGFTVGIPLQLNNQSEPNKENSDSERISCGSKSSRTSRKRLNSLELGTMDYDALEGTSAEAATDVEKRQQNGGTETKEDAVVVSEKAVIGGGQQNNDGIDGGGTTPPGTDNSGNGTVRRRAEGGRIAYLYGVYGACGDASATAFGADDRRLRQHRRPAFTDQANILGYDGVCWDDCCCFVEDDEEVEEETDELLSTHGCVVHSLHTVGDIIGYAKVVRAQRNETLGRLNDVMSQFDALIRSYSLAMKHGTSIRQFAVAGGHSLGGNGGDSANGTPPSQTQLEPAA